MPKIKVTSSGPVPIDGTPAVSAQFFFQTVDGSAIITNGVSIGLSINNQAVQSSANVVGDPGTNIATALFSNLNITAASIYTLSSGQWDICNPTGTFASPPPDCRSSDAAKQPEVSVPQTKPMSFWQRITAFFARLFGR